MIIVRQFTGNFRLEFYDIWLNYVKLFANIEMLTNNIRHSDLITGIFDSVIGQSRPSPNRERHTGLAPARSITRDLGANISLLLLCTWPIFDVIIYNC